MIDDHVPEFRYLSSNKKVATVSESGKVKAEGKGPMGLKEMNKAINEKYVQIEDAKEAQAQNGGPQNQL